MKFNVTISVDLCSVHDNEFVGSVSHRESCSSTTECYESTTDKYAEYDIRIISSQIWDKYHSCYIENGNFSRLHCVKFYSFSMQHSWYLFQISLLPHTITSTNINASSSSNYK